MQARAIKRWIVDAAGPLALLCALALSSPGVNAVRAEPADTIASAAQCEARAPRRMDAKLDAFLEQLRSESAVRAAGERSEIVVLNNRGYNYGPPPGVSLDEVLAEAATAR